MEIAVEVYHFYSNDATVGQKTNFKSEHAYEFLIYELYRNGRRVKYCGFTNLTRSVDKYKSALQFLLIGFLALIRVRSFILLYKGITNLTKPNDEVTFGFYF